MEGEGFTTHNAASQKQTVKVFRVLVLGNGHVAYLYIQSMRQTVCSQVAPLPSTLPNQSIYAGLTTAVSRNSQQF